MCVCVCVCVCSLGYTEMEAGNQDSNGNDGH